MKSITCWAVAAAIFGLSLPVVASTSNPESLTSDVALREGGVLIGQVVDQQGLPVAKSVVSVRYANQEVVRTTTDAYGVFAAKGLRGGQYQLITDKGAMNCRLWATDTAPPAAKNSALVVAGSDVVRAQHAGSGWVTWIKAHPYMTAGFVGTAIAVPLVAASDDWDSGS